MKDQKSAERMEDCQQEPLPEREGTKDTKLLAKEPPPLSQPLGKKKAHKKKKKKAAQDDTEKDPSKSKKQPVLVTSPVNLVHHLSGDETPQNNATKGTSDRTTRNPLFSSSSTISLLTQVNIDPSNDSLRWNGILDDPDAEEERLWNYRSNRRKRYMEYIQQNLPPQPSFTLKNVPQLYKITNLSKDHLGKNKSSSSSSEANKDQSRLNSKLTKALKRQSTAIPSTFTKTV